MLKYHFILPSNPVKPMILRAKLVFRMILRKLFAPFDVLFMDN